MRDLNLSRKNVINYLDGNMYDENNIRNDAHIIKRRLDRELIIKIEALRNVRRQEVSIFINKIKFLNYDKEVNNVFYYLHFPFKQARDLFIESELFGYELNLNSVFFLADFMKNLMTVEQKKYLPLIQEFIRSESLSLTVFKDTFRLRGNPSNKFPLDDSIIVKEVMDAYSRKGSGIHNQSIQDKDNLAVSHYAEYIVSLKLIQQQNLNPNLIVMWVSRYVGDGFGYDFITTDTKTNEVRLIKVKGTLNENDVGVDLTKNETDAFLRCNKPNISYLGVKVVIKRNDSDLHFYVKSDNKLEYIDPFQNIKEARAIRNSDNTIYLEENKCLQKRRCHV